jgi:5'-3' exonuclease
MGIPKFYGSFIRNRYSNTGVLVKELPSDVSSFSLDMNSIFHEVSQRVFKQRSTFEIYFKTLTERLNELINLVNPRQYLILAVDGVAPMTKIIQQRDRRYKSVPNEFFDSNSITPGTDFMIKLDIELKEWIETELSQREFITIYSGHLSPGEGEHKIMKYFRDEVIDGINHIIYGMDADLIVLSLISIQKNIFLVRQDIEDSVDIEQLRKELSKEINITDFALLSFFVGSDFLPVSPMFENLGTSLGMMIDIHKNLNQTLINEEDYRINPISFKKFLSEVAKKEELFLLRESRREKKLGRGIMDKSYLNGKFVLSKFRSLWYESEFRNRGIGNYPDAVSEDKIKRLSIDYSTTLQWIVTYYFRGNEYSDQFFFFGHSRSPLISDVSRNIKFENETEFTFQYINPIVQLICVIPPRSINILPNELRRLINVSNCFKDIMPESFILDTDNKDYEWQGIPLLPLPDPRKIFESVKKSEVLNELIEKLSEKEDVLVG